MVTPRVSPKQSSSSRALCLQNFGHSTVSVVPFWGEHPLLWGDYKSYKLALLMVQDVHFKVFPREGELVACSPFFLLWSDPWKGTVRGKGAQSHSTAFSRLGENPEVTSHNIGTLLPSVPRQDSTPLHLRLHIYLCCCSSH